MQAKPQQAAQTFELKSGHFNLPNLRLLDTDMNRLADELYEQVQQAPAFFLNTPVVIDLGLLSEQNAEVDFALLVGLMRGHGMVPIGIKGGSKHQQEMAELMELAILAEGNNNANQPRPNATAEAAPVPPKVISKPAISKLVTTPVRSGQRIYAAGADLIITSQVSSGAEVIADGNIHVYGSLRGRALAGVKGNREARIFCQKLQAELIAVAGHYMVNENFTPQQMGKPVQISLSGKALNIEFI
ncbi:MAG: septum site-determining protein MinC [Chromatiales bacterium]